MYRFVDTTERQSGSTLLPSEALNINGEYIENLIPGYRTVQVEGRELLETDISDVQIGFQNGSRYQEKRDVTRRITVHYELLAESVEDFREKFNRLCGILDQEQAKLIFLDEPDKFFIGTKCEVGEVEPGRMNVLGSFGFLCTDPYKYSNTMKTALNNGVNTVVLVNNGTKPVPINVKALMQGDNGYLGFTLDERFYQIGNPEEVDGETYEESMLLFDDHLYDDQGWLLNQGITPPVTQERLQNGTVTYVHEEEIEGYVKIADYKNGNSWHGAAVTKIVPADVNGEYPVNWRSSWRFDFNTDGSANKGKEIGHNSVTFSDENDNIIVSVVFEDNNAGLERSDMVIYVGNKRVWDTKNTTKFYITAREGGPCVTVEKIGKQVSVKFSYAGINKTFFVDHPNAQLRKVTWYGATYKSHSPIRNNLLRALNVWKHNVTKYRDIPNYFGAGDEVYIESKKNELYINNILDWDMVDIGSRPLMLPPGEHTLGIIVSSWAKLPEVEVTWRERWI